MVRTVSRMTTALALLAGTLAIPAVASAQNFTAQKYDIKGDGGTDYLTAEQGTGRVFVSRGTHVMVVDGLTGKVLGDIPDTPRTHGIALAPKSNHGFTTNGGDSTSTMFDLKDFHVIQKVHAGVNGLDGIMYDDFSDKILTINHSRPEGTAVVIDAKTGSVVGKVALSGTAPEGGVSDDEDGSTSTSRTRTRSTSSTPRRGRKSPRGTSPVRRPDGDRDGPQDEPHLRRVRPAPSVVVDARPPASRRSRTASAWTRSAGTGMRN